jgi:tetratricopeptide (TPR) repeat protein
MLARETYEELRQQGVAAIAAGELVPALRIFDEALAAARETGDQGLLDRAYCNRALPAIELGQLDESLPELRQILLRSNDIENRYLASYHVARAHELRKEYKKALFYARAAKENAAASGRAEWEASSFNQIGNLLLAESQVEDAYVAYGRALDRMPNQSELWRARILDNLGYCEVLLGRAQAGFTLLFQSLRAIRRARAPRYEISTRLDLCFGYLEIGRLPAARRQAEVALALSEEHDDRESLKNALYLLGEVTNLEGDLATARACFSRLQKTFYPDNAFIPDFLLAIDVRKLINLKA